MHRLIEHAKKSVAEWPSEQPRDLAIAVATLCREILDDGDLPEGDVDWQRLRKSFDLATGQSIAAAIGEWDHLCRLGDFDISDRDAFVKLGIVTWTVKKLLLKLGMLTGPLTQDTSLAEWKTSLIDCLERHVIVPEQRTRG